MPKQKKITKKTTAKSVRKKKPVLLNEAPAVVFLSNTKTDNSPTLNLSRAIKQVSIKKMDAPPVSPYVIEFKNDNELDARIFANISPPPQLKKPVVNQIVLDDKNWQIETLKEQTYQNLITDFESSAEKNIKKHHFKIPNFSKIFAFLREIKIFKASNKKPLKKKVVKKNKHRKSENKNLLKINFKPIKTYFEFAKPALSFAILAIIFVLPATTLSAYNKYEETKDSLGGTGKNIISSINENAQTIFLNNSLFNDVHEQFAQAKQKIESTVGIFDSIIKFVPKAGDSYSSGKYLIDAGDHLSATAQIIVNGFNEFSSSDEPIALRLARLEASLRQSYPLLYASSIELNNVKTNSLPKEISGTVDDLKSIVSAARQSFAATIDILPALQKFLGIDRPTRYLVIFQNTNEIRPTGGFIGSFALLDIDKGAVKSIEIPGGGSYDLQGGLKEHVISPLPLHLIEPHWQFHDANWFPDFPTSAQKLMWFYEKSGGPTVDGVIAINATVVPKLLEITGPIEMPEYNRTFTSENFIKETQQIVEYEYDRVENKPKKLIGALAPKLIERLLQSKPNDFVNILSVFSDSLLNKDIQLYSQDLEIENSFKKAGWTGEMIKTSGDYLMVVAANIAGGKTNEVIQTNLKHKVNIETDGSIYDQITITQNHNGLKGDVFTGVRNVNYLRVYTPLGSKLISAYGSNPPPSELFSKPDADYVPDADLVRLDTNISKDEGSGVDIFDEMDKTVFGGWLQTDPGKSSSLTLIYKLPWKVNFDDGQKSTQIRMILGLPNFSEYTLLIDKQSGLISNIQSEIHYPPNFSLKWHTAGEIDQNTLKFSDELKNYKYSALLFEE